MKKDKVEQKLKNGIPIKWRRPKFENTIPHTYGAIEAIENVDYEEIKEVKKNNETKK